MEDIQNLFCWNMFSVIKFPNTEEDCTRKERNFYKKFCVKLVTEKSTFFRLVAFKTIFILSNRIRIIFLFWKKNTWRLLNLGQRQTIVFVYRTPLTQNTKINKEYINIYMVREGEILWLRLYLHWWSIAFNVIIRSVYYCQLILNDVG